ncbi:type II toxin-antitoxin system RelE family toxin [Methanobrevibacter cuticularis]|uniref:type II toxin-antitoxin system RelE family toxin n=1 Tax=Methanobrevibacter cuticularis TaxID=47311 RepID=UPI000832E6B6|nr:hypothetical protein [Methanobrevibacter cuticularis]
MKKDISFKIKVYPQVDKFLKRLSKKDPLNLKQVMGSIREIEKEPYKYGFIQGSVKARKKRKGDYRIIYMVDDSTNPPEILIFQAEHRKKVYKNIEDLL